MVPDFDAPGLSAFKIIGSLPSDYRGQVLRGSSVKSAVGPNGHMTFQEYSSPQFSIRFTTLDFTVPMKIAATKKPSLLTLYLPIKNDIRYSIAGSGPLHVRQGIFALLQSPENKMTCIYDPEKEYQTMEISWSEDIVRQALSYFEGLKEVFLPKEGNRSVYVSVGKKAGDIVLGIAHEIMGSPYEAGLSGLYFEHKAREMLMAVLVQAYHTEAARVSLSAAQREILLLTGDLLVKNPDKKFPLAELAKAAHTNEMKFKTAFKETFGLGAFEYQMASRMREAKRLLQETDLSTKAISSMVGYHLNTSFITRFREYFGYPPSQVNRKK